MIVVGAGALGYYWSRPIAPVIKATAPTQPRRLRGPSLSLYASPDRGALAGPTAPEPPPPEERHDQTAMAPVEPRPGEHFPDTPVGRALGQHMLILVDVNPGADDRKQRSLEELRKHAKEASETLLDAYHRDDLGDSFGRWLLSLTLGELEANESYGGLKEIANSAIPTGLQDSDHTGSARANESAIRQSATEGLAALARAGNSAAENDLLSLALTPPSGDDAVRTVAIKGYLAAGRDYEARVQTLKTQLPNQYHDVVTLTVSQPEDPSPPDYLPLSPTNGG
jgi:hypothetical protein